MGKSIEYDGRKFKDFFKGNKEYADNLISFLEKDEAVEEFAKANNLARNEITSAVKKDFLFEVCRNYYLKYDFYIGKGRINGNEVTIKADANREKLDYEFQHDKILEKKLDVN